MAIKFEVERGVEPDFPDLCVRCGAPGPESEFRLYPGGSIEAAPFMKWLVYGKQHSFLVPSCSDCAVWMTKDRWRRAGLMWLGCIAGVMITENVVGEPETSLQERLRAWYVVLFALPVFGVLLYFSPVIALERKRKSYVFEFAREDVGVGFRHMNGSAASEVE